MGAERSTDWGLINVERAHCSWALHLSWLLYALDKGMVIMTLCVNLQAQ